MQKTTKNIANQMSIYLNSSSFSHSFTMFIMHEKQNFGPIIFQHGGSATQYEKKTKCSVALSHHVWLGHSFRLHHGYPDSWKRSG